MSDAQPDPQAPVPAAFAPREPIRYPTNAVLGVIDRREQLDALLAALMAGGFLQSEIEVAVGTAAADAIHASTGRGGITGLALRIADRLGAQDEEMELKSQYEQALRDGHLVLVVQAPSDTRKALATRLLREHGAHSVNAYGRFTIEGMKDG